MDQEFGAGTGENYGLSILRSLFGKAEIQVYRCKECGIELILEGQCQLPPDGCVV